MDKQDPSKRMVWEPDPLTAEKILWYGAAACFLIAIISAIGEFRGWWNFVGELGMTIGTLGGIFLSGAAVMRGASRAQVSTVERAVLSNGSTLTRVDRRLISMDGKLDKLEKLEDLDKIQLELDVQTGVLGDQLAVLREVRDGLQEA